MRTPGQEKPTRDFSNVEKSVCEFLLLDEVETETRLNTRKENEVSTVNIEHLSVSWNSNSTEYTLDNINLNFSANKLYIIAGPVGSGKSTLLMAILQELFPKDGSIKVTGKISYACQESWIFFGTLRSNILLGQSFDEKKYERVVNACELNDDFNNLPNGDLTHVGDRGCTLSGGQRARVNLARAIYRDADVYLIDDALVAVDANVRQSIFEKCLQQLLKSKIRILVTSNSQYFKKADEIIIIDNGKVDFCGTYANLLSTGYQILENQLQSNNNHTAIVASTTKSNNATGDGIELKFTKRKNTKKQNVENDKLVGENQSTESSVCRRYFKSGGSICSLLCLTLSLFLAQVSTSGCDYWLAYWMKIEENKNKNQLNDSEINNVLELRSSLYIFAGLLLASVITWTASSLLFYKVCMNASKRLHNQMFASLIKAPMQFFDLNPSGKILNRFSKDTGLVDETLPSVTLDAFHVILMSTGVIIQVLIINYWIIFAMIIMGWSCWKLKDVYLPVAQNLKRLESRAKSPVFSHVNSTLTGLPTIRSSESQQKLVAEFNSFQNIHTSAYHLNIVSSSAFGFWLDILSVSLIIFVTFSFIIMKDNETSSSIVGLAISQILMLYGTVQYGLRQTTEMMTQMVCVERIFEFVNLEQEGPFESEIDRGLKNWPSEGKIQFDQLFLKYVNDEEPVLKNVTFSIKPGEKIGIVGRTGAGKTSLISALFRLVNPEGSLTIDGVDIKSVGLHNLRSKISIIPQDSILFSTSLRDNLDPLHKCNDNDIWKALENVMLKSKFDSLDCFIENKGNNLSTGQKQLLCLARVLIAKNNILILDEATANIDSTTDEIIKKTIKTRFADCTILTIAHRLNTVLDSDRILIINQGEVDEFDEHKNLIEQKTNISQLLDIS